MTEFGPANIKPLLPKRDPTGRPKATITEVAREIPPQTPFQELSIMEPDVLYDPIPIESPYVYGEADCEGRPQRGPDFPAYAASVILLPPPGLGFGARPQQLIEWRPYKQILTIVSIDTAVSIEVTYRSKVGSGGGGYFQFEDFMIETTITIPAGNLPFDLRVAPGQEIWARQNTNINQRISYVVKTEAVPVTANGPEGA